MRTPQQAADAWATAMASAQSKITDGINAVTDSPMAKAASADAQQKYLQNTAQAVNSGKMAQRLNAVSLSDWKTAFLNKVSRIGAGAQTGKPKMLKFLTQFLPVVAAAKAQVRAMPSTTYEQRKARSTAMMDALHQFKMT